MGKRRFVLFLLSFLLLGVACGDGLPTPTVSVPPPPTQAPAEVISPTAVVDQPTLPPLTATPVQATPAATAASPAPTAEPSVTPQATSTAAATETAVPGEMAPGQRNTALLPPGGFDVYTFAGLRFQPLLFFVEAEAGLDVSLAIYLGEIEPGGDLGARMPLATADDSRAGDPEILVFTPQADGMHTAVVTAVTGEGEYTFYFFSATSDAPDVVVRASETLAAGAVGSHAVTSDGARPVIAFVVPQDESDVALEMVDADGTAVATANFAGAGSAEALYVLPRRTTSYTLNVSEVNNQASSYDVLIVALQARETE